MKRGQVNKLKCCLGLTVISWAEGMTVGCGGKVGIKDDLHISGLHSSQGSGTIPWKRESGRSSLPMTSYIWTEACLVWAAPARLRQKCTWGLLWSRGLSTQPPHPRSGDCTLARGQAFSSSYFSLDGLPFLDIFQSWRDKIQKRGLKECLWSRQKEFITSSSPSHQGLHWTSVLKVIKLSLVYLIFCV